MPGWAKSGEELDAQVRASTAEAAQEAEADLAKELAAPASQALAGSGSVASSPTDVPLTEAPDVPELHHFRARLDRAVGHYKSFGSTREAYLEERPHRIVVAVDDDGHGTQRMERVIP